MWTIRSGGHGSWRLWYDGIVRYPQEYFGKQNVQNLCDKLNADETSPEDFLWRSSRYWDDLYSFDHIIALSYLRNELNRLGMTLEESRRCWDFLRVHKFSQLVIGLRQFPNREALGLAMTERVLRS